MNIETNMEWIKLTKDNRPPEKGPYLCFVPDCKHYNEHRDFYFWNGENFIDDSFLGRNRIVEASHFMILEEPKD
jgi:hypothetical protein